MSDFRTLLASLGDHPLAEHDQPEWRAVADATDLSPYICKASFVCGVTRELMASSGLILSTEYHLGALFLALNATELLGRCVGGFRGSHGAGARLERGLEYLAQLAGPLPPLRHDTADYKHLRNFTGHGATSLKSGLFIEPDSTVSLLNRLACALNHMWTDGEVRENFARAEVLPLAELAYGQSTPVYVQQIQKLLSGGTRPGDDIDHETSWRGVVYLDSSSPAVTGRGWQVPFDLLSPDGPSPNQL